MTGRRPCPVAPGPLEDYAARFDDLFGRLAQRRGVPGVPGRAAGAAGPEQDADGLAGAEPVTGAQHPAMQRLQFFLQQDLFLGD
jgi:hypothetical protein